MTRATEKERPQLRRASAEWGRLADPNGYGATITGTT
jgi:hypothetical protein